MADDETIRVMVKLRAPDASAAAGMRTQAIAQSQETVLAEVSSQEVRLLQQFETLPGLAGEVTPQGLDTLLAHPQVESVAPDLPVEIALAESVALIGVDTVWRNYGLTGAGVNIAVLDTGIDPTHPDLADNLVAQKCFGHGICPPDNTDESDSAQDGNGHGTHVAGIITGRGEVTPRGVAPDAGIVAVKVMGDNGAGYTSDVIAALDWLIAHQAELNVSAINLSLGGGAYTGACNAADANTQLYAQAVAAARQAGITIFAAAGNQGQTDALMAPACVSGVVSVGATYDADFSAVTLGSCTDTDVTADQIACATNRSTELDLLAPGIAIVSTAPGGGRRSESGTSMATAHASAAAALLQQAAPGLLPDEVETLLQENGLPLDDPLTHRTYPRLDVLAAVSQVMDSQTVAVSGRVLLQGRSDHRGTQVYWGTDGCNGPPTGAALATTGPDGTFEINISVVPQTTLCLLVVKQGYLAGQLPDPAGDAGVITLPGGDVTGDGLIDIFDLTYIASRINTNDESADLIPDGWVDIFDLVIAAGNYNTSGPVSDWQQ